MGISFMASWKRWPLPIQPSVPRQQQQQLRHPSTLRGREAFFEAGRSSEHLFPERGEILHRVTFKAYACSCRSIQSTKTICDEEENVKVNNNMKVNIISYFLNEPSYTKENTSAYVASLTSIDQYQFSLLVENLDKIEDILASADLVRLQRDILVHVDRLGAQKLFHACLSKTLTAPIAVHSKFLYTEHFIGGPKDFPLSQLKDNIVVHSGKKEKRKFKRMRASTKSVHLTEEEPTTSKPTSLFAHKSSSKARNRWSLIARNESEMSKGVKEVTNLERTRIKLEEEIGHAASYAKWAEASGIDQKTLQQRLQFGWYCSDQLIKSTHSLVVYLARNYRGMGIEFDDLLQAGKIGVLKGAERFDNTRGYKFSTYVQYWIRKSMLALVARHARAIYIPVTKQKIIKQIHKARNTFYDREGRYPEDDEMAKLTGLSLANVILPRWCSSVVGSLDQEIGDRCGTQFVDVIPDTSVKAPDEIIMREHMKEKILELLEGLYPRERQVLLLRHGLIDGRSRSLGEIGRLCCVSKEWIRKIEKAALAKLRRECVQRELKYHQTL